VFTDIEDVRLVSNLLGVLDALRHFGACDDESDARSARPIYAQTHTVTL